MEMKGLPLAQLGKARWSGEWGSLVSEKQLWSLSSSLLITPPFYR